jgi:hypothetical protein
MLTMKVKDPPKLFYLFEALIWLGTIFLICKVCFYLGDLGMAYIEFCSEPEEYSVAFSPDSKRKAVVYARNCENDNGLVTHVSILNNDDSLPNENGNIFIQNGNPQTTNVTINWVDNRELIISYDEEQPVYKNQERHWWVQINYMERGGE